MEVWERDLHTGEWNEDLQDRGSAYENVNSRTTERQKRPPDVCFCHNGNNGNARIQILTDYVIFANISEYLTQTVDDQQYLTELI